YEADNAVEVLADRANGDLADPAEWAADKRVAATAAREYASALRAEADRLGQGARVSTQLLAEAETVALAAEMGGILIDGRNLAEGGAERAWFAGEGLATLAHYLADRDTIERSGLFEHITEDGQVPFWRLRGGIDHAANTSLAPDETPPELWYHGG